MSNILIVIMTILSFLFGFVGVIAFINQKKTEKGYKHLLSQASNDWIGQYTESEIERKQKQLSSLKNQIEGDIPLEAEKSFLKSKEISLKNEIEFLYKDYLLIQGRLKEIGENMSLSPAIVKSIENEMVAGIEYNKTSKRGIAVYFILFLLACSPLFSFRAYDFVHSIISLSGTNLWVDMVVFYVCITIVCFLVISVLKLNRLNRWVINNTALSIVISVLCFALWMLIIYALSFHRLFFNPEHHSSYFLQYVYGFLSIVMLSSASKIIMMSIKGVTCFKKK